jgi:hypothetical protein
MILFPLVISVTQISDLPVSPLASNATEVDLCLCSYKLLGTFWV